MVFESGKNVEFAKNSSFGVGSVLSLSKLSPSFPVFGLCTKWENVSFMLVRFLNRKVASAKLRPEQKDFCPE